MKRIIVTIAIVTFLHGIYTLFSNVKFDQRIKNIKELASSPLADSVLIENHIVNALNRHDTDHARNLLETSKWLGVYMDHEFYQTRIDDLESFLEQTKHNTSQFISGFVYGEGENVYGISGSIISDFMVIGDIRTLNEELNKDESDQDMVNISLSSLGIVLTAGTATSAGVLGAGKFWVSFFKFGKNTKMINPKLTNELTTSINKVVDMNSIKRGNFKNAINKVELQTLNTKISHLDKSNSNIGSIAGTLKSMKHIDSVNEFKNLSKLSGKYKNLTPAILTIFSRSALKFKKVLVMTTKLIISLVEMLFSILVMLFVRIRK